MKQIEECLDRFFNNKRPLKKKWQATTDISGRYLVLFHYHHRVLVYDLTKQKVIDEWWERPADKRGLYSAKIYLENKFKHENN